MPPDYLAIYGLTEYGWFELVNIPFDCGNPVAFREGVMAVLMDARASGSTVSYKDQYTQITPSKFHAIRIQAKEPIF